QMIENSDTIYYKVNSNTFSYYNQIFNQYHLGFEEEDSTVITLLTYYDKDSDQFAIGLDLQDDRALYDPENYEDMKTEYVELSKEQFISIMYQFYNDGAIIE